MTLEQKRNVAITIRLSEAEADLLQEIAQRQHQTKTAAIVTAMQLYAQHLQQTQQDGRTAGAETLTASTDNPGENQQGKPQPTAGATETPTEPQQDSQPDYISKAGNAPQRAAQNATERAGEDQPEQVRIYTEADLRQAIEEAAQQAAQKAARQARQEIKREMRSQAIQATGSAIGAARRAKASTVNAVNGLKPIRIRRPKK